MRPFTSTIAYGDAIRLVIDAAVPIVRTEQVTLIESDGRVLAQDVTSAMDVPPFDRAAMDGYAVMAADTAGASAASPRALHCTDRVFTGQLPMRAVGA